MRQLPTPNSQRPTRRLILLLLDHAPIVLCVVVFATFGLLSATFLEPRNLLNILIQSSALAIVAAGMTFVLITGGVDLSVGSVMYVSVAVAGVLIFAGYPLWLGAAAAVAAGAAAGTLNALVITRFHAVPFIVTLAALFVWRGFGLWLTNTRAMNMPPEVTALGAATLAGVPLPVVVFAVICACAHVALTRTPAGRQLYAVGDDADAARKAGIDVRRRLFMVYVIAGVCAALSGLVSLSQTGAVSPSFGQQREFAAIAAAVLGGTSLFGGRGNVLPGTVLGAVLIQAVENGLVIINANPYVYPLVTSGIIFVAVLLDSTRTRLLAVLTRRQIRVDEAFQPNRS
jgi:ribose transport system permease protein